MPQTVTLFVVPHLHWDREWYEPAVRFRQRLVDTLDAALEALESSDAAGPLLLDGQTVLVRDYLDVRPDQRARVEALVRGGRLLVGPWYVLTDELLPSDETLVRNLLLGRADGAVLGGWLPVGYSPDAFGHPAALPTVLSGFGIRCAILWRGYAGRSGPRHDLFRWCGPDGSAVLVHHLPPEGYEVGARLPVERTAMRERWGELRATLAIRAPDGPWLLLSGADHHRYQTTLPDAVNALGAIDATVHARLASPEHYFEAVPRDATVPEVRGELRDSYGYTWTLQGVHATRSRLKRRIAEGERLLLRWAEPAAALAALHGGPARLALLDAAWRAHLENCFHDSFAGTTTDEVARDVDRRAGSVIVQARGVLVDAIHDRLDIDRAAVRATPAAWVPAVAIVNPSAHERGGVCECTITVPRERLVVGFPPSRRRGRSPGWPAAPALSDASGKPIPIQVLAQYRAYERLDAPDDHPMQWSVAAFRVACLAEAVPPLGLAQLRVIEGRPTSESTPHVWLSGRRLAADWGTAEPDPAGGFVLTDHERGRFAGLASLVSEGDRGDAYTHQADSATPPLAAEFGPSRGIWRGPLVAVVARAFRVPGRARGVVYARLDAGSRLLRFVVEGWNLCGGHRLRVRFPLPAGCAASTALADMHYGPVERRLGGDAVADSPMEQVTATAPMHRFISVDGGLTVFGRGTYECELTPDGAVAVTLVRAVGELSRDDLTARPGHAAWPAAIPDAQELGPFRVEMAVAPLGIGSGSSVEDLLTVEALAEEFHAPLGGLTLNWAVDPPPSVVGPRLDGQGLVLKAVKPSRDGRGVVLRCVNLTAETVRGAWVFEHPVSAARLVALDESMVAPLVPIDSGRRVEFVAGPRAVVSVEVEPLLNRPS